MNIYLIIILVSIIGHTVLDLLGQILNLRRIDERLPDDFKGWYDEERYRKSISYLRDNTRFDVISSGVSTLFLLAFLLAGGFGLVDRVARHVASHEILQGLVFTGILVVGGKLLSLPFSIYHTFVLEQRYEFNRTTPRTFVIDLLKGLLLLAVIGGPILALIIWLFRSTGPLGWLIVWGALSAVQLVLTFAAPMIIMPLFNRFSPLPEGDLRTAIETYARAQAFKMKGVFTMDGSKRSAKSNAFFTGFGRSRRIVLFDTLIEKHPVQELVAVIAHEMGHYRLGHIPLGIVRHILITGLTLALLSFFLNSTGLFAAFGVEHMSIYAGLVFFGYLYAPVAMVLGLVDNCLSRRHEREADRFAVTTTANPQALADGLQRLSVDNLGNLNPHPFKVFMEYSHPPIRERIRLIKGIKVDTT